MESHLESPKLRALRADITTLAVDAIVNAANSVVDNESRNILAYLGGTDYFCRQGMVDMVTARRSPGSTLKPFIYGLAFDDGLIEPETLIEDGPEAYGAGRRDGRYPI